MDYDFVYSDTMLGVKMHELVDKRGFSNLNFRENEKTRFAENAYCNLLNTHPRWRGWTDLRRLW